MDLFFLAGYGGFCVKFAKSLFFLFFRNYCAAGRAAALGLGEINKEQAGWLFGFVFGITLFLALYGLV
jgi:hypothetical protein